MEEADAKGDDVKVHEIERKMEGRRGAKKIILGRVPIGEPGEEMCKEYVKDKGKVCGTM